MQTTNPTPLSLGAGARPTTGTDLADRLRRTLVAETAGAASGLERLQVAAEMAGADVTSVDVDLTGVTLSLARRHPAEPATAEIVSREPARVGRLRVAGHPVTAVDLPVDLEAELTDLPIAWVEDAAGGAGIEPVEPTAEHPVRGHARVAAPKAGLVATARGLLTVVLAQQGVTLTDLQLDIESQGPRAARLRARASVRKGVFLSATIDATASAAVDADLVLTLGDVSLTSGNPLVAALLGTVRGKVEAVANQTFDLGANLPAGVEVTDVRLDVGQDLVLSVRLG